MPFLFTLKSLDGPVTVRGHLRIMFDVGNGILGT